MHSAEDTLQRAWLTADTQGVIMHEQGTVPAAGCGPGGGLVEPES